MKDYTILENFLEVQHDVPFWYDQAIHRRVCELMKDNKLVTCKFLVDKSKEYSTKDTFGLRWAKEQIADRLQYYLSQSPNLEEQRDKMRQVLLKLIDAFPEMETDEPINGSDAVDVLCQLWSEIKEAVKE